MERRPRGRTTQLASDQASAYWGEVTRIGRAVEICFEPAKMNYLTLGNNVPHLHTHIVPRPWTGDPDPNRAPDFGYLDAPRQPEAQVRDTAQRLRDCLAGI
jgi:diadenosine tetraphosphate (Ap4A) HIT family hydrolase